VAAKPLRSLAQHLEPCTVRATQPQHVLKALQRQDCAKMTITLVNNVTLPEHRVYVEPAEVHIVGAGTSTEEPVLVVVRCPSPFACPYPTCLF
jgi:hypothetical protein